MNSRLAKKPLYYVVRATTDEDGTWTSLHGRGRKDRQKAADAAKRAVAAFPKDRFYVTKIVSGFTSSDLVSYNRYDA